MDGEEGEKPKARSPRPKVNVWEAADAAYDEARAKLDALIARPCREDSIDAIALCQRAATLMSKERGKLLKMLEKERSAATKMKEAAKRKAAAARLKGAVARTRK